MPNTDLGALAEQAAAARVKLVEGRDLARNEARALVAAIEQALVRALAGDFLRGAPQLAPGFYGWQVRGRRDEPLTSNPSLVLTRAGVLVLACRTRLGVAQDVFVELRAEDLALAVATATQALEDHVLRIERTAANYAEVVALAAKLRGTLGLPPGDGHPGVRQGP